MKEVMRSATTNEDSTGAEREEAKGLIDYIQMSTENLIICWTKLFRVKEGRGSHQERGEGGEGCDADEKMPNVEKELQCLLVPCWAWVRAGVNKPTAQQLV